MSASVSLPCECGHEFSQHVNPDVEGVSYCKIRSCMCSRYVLEGWDKQPPITPNADKTGPDY